MTHPFTLSNFGPGPFRVVAMYDNAKRLGVFGALACNGTCAHCGTMIRYEFIVECQTTGARNNVGSSCVEKTDMELYAQARKIRREFNAMLRERTRAEARERAEQDAEDRFNAGIEEYGLEWALDAMESKLDMFEIKRLNDALANAKRFGLNQDVANRLHSLRPLIERRMLAFTKPHGTLPIGKGRITGEIVAYWLQESAYGVSPRLRVWDLQNNITVICTAPKSLFESIPRHANEKHWLVGQQVTIEGTVEAPYRTEPGAAYSVKRPKVVGPLIPMDGWAGG